MLDAYPIRVRVRVRVRVGVRVRFRVRVRVRVMLLIASHGGCALVSSSISRPRMQG